ncbi:MAG: hypothetical protein KKF44_08190 [Nanoarchaeota archaeon]|nr:hypothetical protein [Nanoarchaeota archaeon]
MSVFIVFTLFIKFLKTLFPFPITPEPIVFFPILITMFWGLKFGVLFLFLVVVLFDLVIGRFNDATFVCFLMVLFICLLAVPLGHLIPSYFALGILLSFFYMMIYILIRTKILGIRIFDVLSPAISCFLFNYLYFSFLMPIVKPLMTIV